MLGRAAPQYQDSTARVNNARPHQTGRDQWAGDDDQNQGGVLDDGGLELPEGGAREEARELRRQGVKPLSQAPQKPLPPHSSRNLECNLGMLMDQYLGQAMPRTGKETVMDLATASVKPRFSRYSGVTEWRNATFLWVNIGGNDYTNLFRQELRLEGRGGGHHLGGRSDERKKTPGSPTPHVRPPPPTCSLSCQPSSGGGSGGSSAPEPFKPGMDSGKPGGGGSSSLDSDGGGDDRMNEGRNGGGGAIIKVTWFAGSRMTEESPAIARMLPRHQHPSSPSRTPLHTTSA
ncbi:unnamed protein product, partial [Discosporangium mesarthrocarpum]